MTKKIYLIVKLFIAYIFVLGLCFLLYKLVVLPTSGAEKVNAIIGLLGWSATIFAPVSAFFLLDNWKDQTKYNAILDQVIKLTDELSKLSIEIDSIRSSPQVFSFLYKLFLAYKPENDKDNTKFDMPDFTSIYQVLENIRICNLKIYLYDEKLENHVFQRKSDNMDSYANLEKNIKGLEASFYSTIHYTVPIDKGINTKEAELHLQKCLFISRSFADAYRSSIIPDVENVFLNELNNSLFQCFEDVKKFRKELN